MKRIFTFLVLALALFLLASCGKAEDASASDNAAVQIASEESLFAEPGWPSGEYSALVPVPSCGIIESAETDPESGFSAVVAGAKLSDAKAYCELCKKEGFIEAPLESELSDKGIYTYSAKNSDGFKLDISFAEGKLHISVVK